MSKVFLRQVIGEYMEEIGKDSSVVLVNADLMMSCRNKGFCDKYPQRAFNVGIAEQNMVSFSAGLAHEGFTVYAFSMAAFISMRACEQCRTDIAYGNKNVRLIGVYSGCASGLSGATHWGMEDVAIYNSMPNMTVMEPCDPVQARRMLDLSVDHKGPMYIRCSVEPVDEIYADGQQFVLGKATVARDGENCCGTFICSGITVHYALAAAEKIKQETGKDIRVLDMHTVKPIDRDAIISAAETGNIITAQDHFITGGLGSITAMVIAEENLNVRFKALGIPDRFDSMARCGYLYRKYEIDADGLYSNMMKMIG